MPEHTISETIVVVTEALEGPAVGRWRDHIAAAAEFAPRLVVDLRRSSRIDADATVMFLKIHRAMVRADGRLLLRGPGEQILPMLALARVTQVLNIEEPASDSPVSTQTR